MPPGPSAPAPGRGRIETLDVVRGVALLGILIMNMPDFVTSYFAEADGSRLWTGTADRIAEVGRDMLFSGKHLFLSSADAGSPACMTGSANYLDIQGVAAHEVGHLIGLGDSYTPEATMAPTLAYCDTKNVTLDIDDTSGAAFIYPQIDVLRGEVGSLPPASGLGSYFPLAPKEKKSVSIRLNAAYLGTYYLPGISAEAMYDAAKHARSKGQWVKVVK